MRVLFPGRDQKGPAKILYCNLQKGGCGAKLLVEETDLITVQICHQGDCEYKYQFLCGHCGTKNLINVYDFP